MTKVVSYRNPDLRIPEFSQFRLMAPLDLRPGGIVEIESGMSYQLLKRLYLITVPEQEGELDVVRLPEKMTKGQFVLQIHNDGLIDVTIPTHTPLVILQQK